MKVSIVTVCYNSAETIADTIESVMSQTYPDIEHIVVDGNSSDNTRDVVRKYKDAVNVFVSEPDRGIYDAMNKGINRAGGDVVGTLNADDVYVYEGVIADEVSAMKDKDIDVCWGDLEYRSADFERVVRRWSSSSFRPEIFKSGWHPPHPTFFVKKRVYETYGLFRFDMPIAADYELMLRLLEKEHVKSVYIPRTLIYMRVGGESNRSIANIVRANKESYRAWRVNNLSVKWWYIARKLWYKVRQLRIPSRR